MALSHLGFIGDVDRLASVRGVDLIIGGDTHTILGVEAGDIG